MTLHTYVFILKCVVVLGLVFVALAILALTGCAITLAVQSLTAKKSIHV